MTSVPESPCPRCGTPPTGCFCSGCGVERVAHRITLKDWLSDLFDSLFSIDGRFRTTLRTLIFRPGILSLHWLQGRRELYASPLRIYIVCSALYFAAVMSVFAIDPDSGEFKPPGIDQHLFDDSGDYQGEKLFHYLKYFAGSEVRVDLTVDRMQRFGSLILIASIPLLALAFYILFRRSGHLYLEHLVFTTHLIALWLLLFTFEALADLLRIPIEPGGVADLVMRNVSWVILALIVLYSAIAVRTFYKQRWLATVAKSIGAFTFYGIFMMGIVMAVREMHIQIWADRHDRYWHVIETFQEDGQVDPAKVHAAIVDYLRLPAGEFSRGPHTRFHVAELLLIANRPQEALELAAEVLVTYPEDPYTLAVAAAASCRMEQPTQAAEFAERHRTAIASASDPDREIAPRHEGLLEKYIEC